jgi:hypothetical protein
MLFFLRPPHYKFAFKPNNMKILYATLFILISLQASAAAPTIPSSNLYFAAVDGGYFNLGWTPGNGTRRIIICKAGSNVTFSPQNGVDYAENTVFGSGQQVASGEFVIYDNAFSSFYVTGLSPATQYFFKIVEYNGTGATAEYLNSSFLTGSASTSAVPTIQVSNASFSNITTNSMTVNWTEGNGQRRLIVVRQGSPVNADPVNSQQYSVNSSFGNGATIGTGNYTVYNSTGNGTSITNLQPGTQYFFAFYEFNGSGQPQYKTPAYTTNVTTRSIPTIASSNVIIAKTDGKELSLNWTNGNGQRRIIVANQSSNITSVPVNGTDYNANPVFGSGQQLGAGEYVVFDDNFNAATITGLNPATTYFFKLFEYDGTGSNTMYLTSSFATINGPTAVTPTLQTTNISATNITSSSLTIQLTAGNGRARMIVGRKNAAVNITPTDLTAYTGNGDFGVGQNLGNGNFVLSNTTDPFAGIHNLEANTNYHFAIFEFNGFNQPLYLSPAATFSATTLVALPVKLIKWEATPSNEKVKLQWITSSEINASHFIIERSSNGINFSPIATVQAAGNSQANINYSKEDNAPVQGKSYYRLKMTDIDGRSEYSPVRTVLVSAKQIVKLAGNPVQNNLELITSASVAGNKNEWAVITITGQAIKKGIVSSGRTVINVSVLPAGNYWLRLNLNGEVQTLGFSKQ